MTYNEILRKIGLPILAIRGGQVAAVETNYLALNWDSARFPLSFVKDCLADAAVNFAMVIAETANHPWRAYLESATANVAHEAVLPVLDSDGKPMLGVYGAILDAENSEPLTEKPLEYVQRVRRLKASSQLYGQYYHFQRVGTRLYHTRDNVKVQVCVFDREAERAKIEDNEAPTLPEALSAALACETLSMMMQGDEFMAQAAQFALMADRVKQQIRQGLTSVVSEIPEQGGQ